MRAPFVLLANPCDPPYPYESPPLSLFSLGSFLEANGIAVEYFDERTDPFSAYRRLMLEKPLLAGFSVMGGRQLRSAARLTCAARRFSPDTRTAWGGVFPSRLTSETMEWSGADFVLRGEAEHSLLALCRALLEGKKDLSGIEGLAWREEGRTRLHPGLPAPDPGSFPFAYSGKAGEYVRARPAGVVLGWETSRGCASSCGFCYSPYFHGGLRVKSPGKIEEEAALLARLGPARVDVHDDLIAGGSAGGIGAVCGGLGRSGIPWTANLRVDMASRETLERFAASGCRELYFGLESDSGEDLASLGKGFGPRELADGLAALRSSGIKPIFSVIAGLPGGAAPARALAFASRLRREHPGCEVQVQSYVPLPGTPLYRRAVEAGFRPPADLAGWASLDHLNSPLPWLDDPMLASKAYLTSYFAFRHSRHIRGAAAVFSRLLHLVSLFRVRTGFFGLYAEGAAWRMTLRAIELWRGAVHRARMAAVPARGGAACAE